MKNGTPLNARRGVASALTPTVKSNSASPTATASAPTVTRRVQSDCGRTAISAVTTKYAVIRPAITLTLVALSRNAMTEPLRPMVSMA